MNSARTVRLTLKLQSLTAAPRLNQVRSVHWNHVIPGPPTVRYPFWKKMALMSIFPPFMFSYPLYVTYMMWEWDQMDGNH